MPDRTKITQQQEQLCQAYVGEAHLVKTKAAAIAGYSTHNVTALFKRDGIQAARSAAFKGRVIRLG